LLKGFTDNYIPVRVEGSDEMMNRIAQVQLVEQVNRTVRGHIVID
jgi:hypothetical protein